MVEIVPIDRSAAPSRTPGTLGRGLCRVLAIARSTGPVDAALHDFPLRAINRVVELHLLEARALVPQSLNPTLMDAGRFRAGFAQRDELLADALAEYDMSPTFVEEARARGDECFALRDGDRLVSFSWYARRPRLIIDRLVVHFDPPWLYSYKGFPHPDYRGQRLQGTTLSLALRSYCEHGWRSAIGFLRSNNLQSRRSVDRAGWRAFGRVFLVEAFGRSMGWCTPGCTAYGARLQKVASTVSSGTPRGDR